ncbi:MAG: hypothetical protein TREMPRED_004361 [Tremellales sp. Tagirdzhanova-0007]|nr:MAG: hypothetical protein TREMPRED_004361 [Tremellales sp. Tagirdzhanova-0007]
MAPPTDEQQDLWGSQYAMVPFNDLFSSSRFELTDIDPLPEADAKGRRKAEGWTVSWQGVVDGAWTNYIGNLHGAAAAWIVDTCTSAALIGLHTPTFWGPPMMSGVSVAMDMQYLAPAPQYTELLVVVEVIRLTTTLANTKCDIKDLKTGKLYVSGTHIKAWKALDSAKL